MVGFTHFLQHSDTVNASKPTARALALQLVKPPIKEPLVKRVGNHVIAMLVLTSTACAVQKQHRIIPAGTSTPIKSMESIAPVDQKARLLVRVQEGGAVEARLSEPPLCNRIDKIAHNRLELEERTLQTPDKVAMWTGYAGAAAIAGLVGVGMANGSDKPSGFTLMAVFGLPLAAVGVVESVRAIDIERPADPELETRESQVACSEPEGGWPMHIHRGDEEVEVMAGTTWRTVSPQATGSVLPSGYSDFKGTASIEVPLDEKDGQLAARIDDSLDRQIGMLMAASRKPAPETPSPIVKAAAVVQAPAPQAPVKQAQVEVPAEQAPIRKAIESPRPRAPRPVCEKLASTRYGVMPLGFFDQPTRNYTVRKGDWLSRISARVFGDPMEFPQLFLLNREELRSPDLIYVGQELKLPSEPRSMDEWQGEIPPACRRGE